MPRWQAMFVSVNKAASTSLKWLVADIQDERPEQFHRSLSSEVSRTMTIHQRRMWAKTPTAASLSDEELAGISPTDGWFVFGAVRHPTARLFSAWQSKLLLREARYVKEFGNADWFPRVPQQPDDIVADFSRFVSALGDEANVIMRDRHFRQQHSLLKPNRIPYSRIYRTSEIPQLVQDLEGHVRARGYDGAPLKLRRVNETPLPPVASLFTPEVLTTCSRLYRSDFAAFGFENPMPTVPDVSDHYTGATVAEVGRLIERAERIGDLSRLAKLHRAKSNSANSSGDDVGHPGRRIARRLRGWTGDR